MSVECIDVLFFRKHCSNHSDGDVRGRERCGSGALVIGVEWGISIYKQEFRGTDRRF